MKLVSETLREGRALTFINDDHKKVNIKVSLIEHGNNLPFYKNLQRGV